MSVIDKLIQIANAEVGYLEKSSNSQLDRKTANAGTANYTKYWRDIKPEYQGQPWLQVSAVRHFSHPVHRFHRLSYFRRL